MVRHIKNIASMLTVVGLGYQENQKRTGEENLKIHEFKQEDIDLSIRLLLEKTEV